MESSKNAKWLYLITGLIVGGIFGYSLAASHQPKAIADIITTVPVLTDAQRNLKAPLSDAEKKAVAFHKNAIIQRLSSGVPLTSDEKRIVFTIALTDQGLYDFSPKEREMLGSALK